MGVPTDEWVVKACESLKARGLHGQAATSVDRGANGVSNYARRKALSLKLCG